MQRPPKTIGIFATGETALSEKLRRKNAIAFYQAKINCIQDRRIPVRLLLMICQDVSAVRPGDLSCCRQKRNYANKCIHFYQAKIKKLQAPDNNWWTNLCRRLPRFFWA